MKPSHRVAVTKPIGQDVDHLLLHICAEPHCRSDWFFQSSAGDSETVDMSAIKQEPPSSYGDEAGGAKDTREAGGGKAKKASR